MNTTHPPIQHITELFAYDGAEFIAEAYRNLLDREPDPHGLRYYLGRLALGYSKAAVAVQLASSPECKKRDQIAGIKQLIQQEKQAAHWLWGKFVWRPRLERTLNSQQAAVSRFHQDVVQLQTSIASQLSQLASAVDRAAAQQASTSAPHKLPSDTVRQLFIEILGREPESEEVITQHAMHESINSLRQALLNSPEFQSSVSALPEYARTLLQRQLQVLQHQSKV